MTKTGAGFRSPDRSTSPFAVPQFGRGLVGPRPLTFSASANHTPAMRRALPVLLVLAPPAIAGDFSAKVVDVSDGDTLTVLQDGRTQIKVRLHGIDAPDAAQPFGSRSKQSLSDLAFGQVVTIQERDRDREQ